MVPRLRWIVALAMALLAVPAFAATLPPPSAEASQRPAKIPALSFAKRSGFSDLRLSPDGRLLAFRAIVGGEVNIAIFNASDQTMVRRVRVPEQTTLEWLDWAGNGKLLVAVSAQSAWFGLPVRITRLYFLDLASGALNFIGRKEMALDGDDVIHVDPDGNFVLLSIQKSIWDYPSVWRFPLDASGGKSGIEIQKPKPGVWSWFTDSGGIVRMGFEFTATKKLKIWYRSTDAEKFREIAKISEDKFEDQIWDVLRIVSNSDQGIVLKPDDSGRIALRKFDYATRTTGEVIYSAPGWDVTGASFGDDDQLIAAYYTDDRDRVVWFDSKMKALQARLDRALKGNDIWITARARDDSRMVVWAGREDDPGQYFIYSAAGATLNPFITELPELDRAMLATPKPIAFTARDGTAISGYLTLPRGRPAKSLPLIILPHGGPYGIRDKLDFSSEVQFLANRGYAVLQPNFRGSDGYGEAFDELGRGQIGRKMQDDLDDAMDWAVKEGIASPDRVCVVGSSYGGYAALWAVTRNPERYRCAASFAGVTDWKRQLKYDAGFFTRKNAKKWRTTVQGEDSEFDLDLVSPAPQVARLTRPVLLSHGKKDNNVPFEQFDRMSNSASKAKIQLETLVFEDEGHGFDKPENEAKWYEALEAFLAKHNPAD